MSVAKLRSLLSKRILPYLVATAALWPCRAWAEPPLEQSSAPGTATSTACANGSSIRLELKNADVLQALSLYSTLTGNPVIPHSDLSGKVTILAPGLLPKEKAARVIREALELQGLQFARRPGNTVVVERPEKRASGEASSQRTEAAGHLVLPVRFAHASKLASMLTTLFNGELTTDQSGNKTRPRSIVSMVADSVTNSIVVSGSARVLAQVRDISAGLDQRAPQVLLKTLIGDLNSAPSRQFGIQWLSLKGQRSLGQDFGQITRLSAAPSLLPTAANDTPIGQNSIPDSIAGTALGMRYSVLNPSGLDWFVKALESTQHLNVLASPQIVATNNVPATFFVGFNQPVQTTDQSSPEGFSIARRTDYIKAGLNLKITPSITPLGDVNLDLDLKFQEQSAFSEAHQNPIFASREFQTTVSIQNEHTLIIAGLLRNDMDRQEDRVPLLSRIPLLGMLFRDRRELNARQELILLLTPSILEDARIGSELSRQYSENHFVRNMPKEYRKKWDEQVHYFGELSNTSSQGATQSPESADAGERAGFLSSSARQRLAEVRRRHR